MAALSNIHLLWASSTSVDLPTQHGQRSGSIRPCLVLGWTFAVDGHLAARWATEGTGAVAVPPD